MTVELPAYQLEQLADMIAARLRGDVRPEPALPVVPGSFLARRQACLDIAARKGALKDKR